MRYHIIDSIKGGCGKSTFAIMTAAAINEFRKKEPVCLFDMDLQGTSMAYLLFGTSWKDKQKTPDGLDIYLNERIRRSDAKGEKYIKKVVWEKNSPESSEEILSDTDEDFHEEFYVSPSSPIQKDKDQYKPRSSQNYSPGVSYGRFRYGLSKLLTSDELCGELEEKIEHVILDMPPNSDGYSDAVIDFLMDGKRNGYSKPAYDYCIMLTRDYAHQQATMNWLRVFLTHDLNRNFPRNLIFTLAMTPRDAVTDEKKERKVFEEWVKRMKADLKKMTNLKESDIENIYFLAFHFNAQYYKRCCEQDGIINNPVDIRNPVKYIQAFDGEINVDNATEAFIQLLCE